MNTEHFAAELETLRASFIRYIVLDRVCNHGYETPEELLDFIDELNDAMNGGAVEYVTEELAYGIPDVIPQIFKETRKLAGEIEA